MKGLIIVGDLFEDVEFIAPLDVWKRNKDEVVVASMMKRKTVISKLGIEMTVDATIEEITLDDFDFLTTFSAVAATINNIGPGFNVVGPTGNFSSFSYLSKLVFAFDMIAGRLEILPVLVMLYPKTWRKKNISKK